MIMRPFGNFTLADLLALGSNAKRRTKLGGSGEMPLTLLQLERYVHGTLHAKGTGYTSQVVRPIATLLYQMGGEALLAAWVKSVKAATKITIQVNIEDGYVDASVKTGLATQLVEQAWRSAASGVSRSQSC